MILPANPPARLSGSDIVLTHQVLPRAEWLASLATKRSAVAILLLNTAQELLLVKPSYRNEWLTVGGVVEKMESPLQAAQRELFEEVGLKDLKLTLRATRFTRSIEDDTESYQFVFSAPALTPEQIKEININGDEIIGFDFYPLTKAISLLPPRLAARIDFGAQHLKNNSAGYLDNIN